MKKRANRRRGMKDERPPAVLFGSSRIRAERGGVPNLLEQMASMPSDDVLPADFSRDESTMTTTDATLAPAPFTGLPAQRL